MHSLVIFWWFIKTSRLPYRQMSLFITSPSWSWSFIWWCLFIYIVVLLERAAKMSKKIMKVVLLTALPVVTNTKCDVSAYISTNVISITEWTKSIWKWFILFVVFDLRSTVGISVSRVGSAAQLKNFKEA